MSKKKSAYIFIAAVSLLMMIFGGSVNAQQISLGTNDSACKEDSEFFLGLPTWYKYLDFSYADGECDVNFKAETDIPKVLLAIFEIIMRLLGVVAVVMTLYGGFTYIMSQGEPEATKNAKNTIINALIGLAIALSATVIVNLIGNNLL